MKSRIDLVSLVLAEHREGLMTPDEHTATIVALQKILDAVVDECGVLRAKLRAQELRLQAADEFIKAFHSESQVGRLDVVRDGLFEQLYENYRAAPKGE